MEQNSQPPALTTALAYHHAWTTGDIDGAMEHVADDITCEAPGATLRGTEAYRTFLHGFSRVLTGVSDVAALGDEEHVMLFYYPHTPVTTTAPAAEYFTFRDGLIAESLLVFDRPSYAPPTDHQS